MNRHNYQQIYEETGKTHSREDSPQNLKRKRKTLEHIQVQGKTLEIGCAEGWLTKDLAKKTETYAIDISSTYLARAKAAAPRARYIRADAQALPIKTGTFKTVLCEQVLEHIPEPQRATKEIHRVLERDGTAIITIPNALHWKRIGLHILRQAKRTTKEQYHLHNTDPGLVYNWLKESGFADIRITGINNPPLMPQIGETVLVEAKK